MNEYGDENRLIREVFESPLINEWVKSEYHLHLFIDSLDECLIEVPKIAAILRNRINELREHTSRLNLRISCRTGIWPEILTDEFCAIWGDKNVGVYELAPLRRKDVSEAAQTCGLDPILFMKAIENKEIQPLAINPLTLKYLLNEFKKNQNLSSTRSQLFLTGCELLCTENNPYRESSERTGLLSPSRRLALASRIAAVMVFCNRLSIHIKSDASGLDETILTLSMLQEGEETTGNYNFIFTQRDLLETVKQTALFSGRGPNRFGFTHQSYAEFLAARYLSLHQLSIQQVKSLIQISNDPDRMVIPQLKETTAWLNSILPDMVEETIKTDPQSILSADIESLEFRFRRDLVGSLLNQFEQQKISDSDWGRYIQYQKLKHPDLAIQLRPYIEDKEKHFLVRRVAIDIAEACQINELQDLLADIALDDSDHLHIRDQAAYAVAQIADDRTRLRLKALALNFNPGDKDDQLKGSSLNALWPKHLTAQEIFDALTPRRRESLYGSYASFLINFPKQLKIEDLPCALRWVKNNPGDKEYGNYQYENLPSNILLLAWQHLERADILDAYAEAIIPRIENYLRICPLPNGGSKDQSIPNLSDITRKNLIKAIVSKIQNYRDYLFVSVMDNPQILFKDDLRWLIEQLEAETDRKRTVIWVEIINNIYQIERAEQTELILQAMANCPVLAEKFESIFEPVILDSPRAKSMKEIYEKHQRVKKKHEQRQIERKERITPSVLERIETCLKRFENGDSNGWWQMCLEMTIKDNSQYYGDEFNSDLVSQPGWEICDNKLKERIVSAGKKYIIENDSATDRWLGTNTYHRPAMAGYKAFKLQEKLDPCFLDTLPSDIWHKWASVFIGYPESFGITEKDDTFLKLIKRAYLKAPQKIINALLVLIDKENTEHDHLFSINKIRDCLDQDLQIALLKKAKDSSLKVGCFQDILTLLISSNYRDAQDYAESLLNIPLNDELQKRAKAASLSLLIQAKDAGWGVVWPVVKANNDFGKDLFLSLPNSFRYIDKSSLPERIGEKNTAELFVWLSRNFPRNEDPIHEGAHTVGPRESLANYRDNLLSFLENKGTNQSIKALEIIKQELPEHDFLNFYMIKARENVRRKNWSPLFPNDFLLFVKNSTSRLILNSEDLLDALIESLIRLEKKLQGETPSAIYLWDKTTNTKLKPKSENDFSDFVKVHITEDLQRNGIVALREVEIRRRQGEGGSPGERTDIYVSGFVPSKQEYVRVIIEAKGCWHKEVGAAMETQLLNRYLNETGCDHGIYLVGWFPCNQWDKRDSRKNKLSCSNIEEARSILDKQAKSLCSDMKTIKACVLNCALR